MMFNVAFGLRQGQLSGRVFDGDSVTDGSTACIFNIPADPVTNTLTKNPYQSLKFGPQFGPTLYSFVHL
jgi:hypothetical protein